MCKMVYRIRSVIAYTWDQGGGIPAVLELWHHDETFLKMVEIVRKNIGNLFTGTDPYQEILGDNKGYREVRITRTMTTKHREIVSALRSTDKTEESSVSSEELNENDDMFGLTGVDNETLKMKQMHPYDRVAHLCPNETEFMYRVLMIFAR